MKVTTHQLLQQVKNALVISVFITCIVLMTVGWKNMDQRGDGAFVRPRTYIYTKDSQSFSLASSPEPTNTSTAVQQTKSQQTPTASKSQDLLVSNQGTSCNNPNATVLGRPLDRCAASEAVKLAEEEDIYVSVKTTARNHKGRILPDLLTWFQTLNPQRVHIVTDTALKNETFYQVANKIGIDVVTTDCESVHSHKALCCKSMNEYFRYFNSTTASGDLHRWYCHFDDDMYVNIPALVPALREAMNKSADGGVYFGRWPEEVITKPWARGVHMLTGSLKKLGFDFKKDFYVKWATGAAYCLSSVVMKKLKVILTNRTFEQYCAHFRRTDDITAAILIAVAGYAVSDNKNIITQYDKLAEIPVERLKTLITSSKGKDNTMKIPGSIFTSEEDETSFLSYHCLLYPSTSWCKKSN